MHPPTDTCRGAIRSGIPILVRAAAGLFLLGFTGFGRPALIDRRTGTVRRP